MEYSLDAAQKLASLGYAVIPVRKMTKRPCDANWPERAAKAPAQVQEAFSPYPGCNVGIVTGPPSGVLVVDVDCTSGEFTTWVAGRDWPAEQPTVQTPRGTHYYFAYPEVPIGNSVTVDGVRVDIRGKGGQAVAYGSTPDGQYVAHLAGPLPELPTWLFDLLYVPPASVPTAPTPVASESLTSWGTAALSGASQDVSEAPEGERNNTLHRAAAHLANYSATQGISPEIIESTLMDAANLAGLPDREAAATIASGIRRGLEDPRDVVSNHDYDDEYEEDDWADQEAADLFAYLDEEPDDDDCDDDTPATGTRLAPNLPDDFWKSRMDLAQIRQAAESRMVSPDAVLGAVLARVAAATPPNIQLPPLVGGAANLTWYTGITGAPEAGKSQAVKTATELLPLDAATVKGPRAIGTGEGLIEAFLHTDENGDKTVAYPRVLVKVDEGEVLTQFSGRNGSTIAQTLRSAWSSEELGQENASQEHRRHVPAGEYSLGLTLCIQPKRSAPLFEQASGGTVQRFAWFSANDPSAPAIPPPWPGAMSLPPLPVDNGLPRYLDLAPAIAEELLTARRAGLTGTAKESDPMDAHKGLLRLKGAALLAVAEGRLTISDDDWRLAGMIVDTSASVRSAVQAVLTVESRREAGKRQHAKRLDAQATAVGTSEATAKIEQSAATMFRALEKGGPKTSSELRKSLRSNNRRYAEAGLQSAVDQGLIRRAADDRYEAITK